MSRDSSRRTYAEALEELGGEPWRKFNGTEQWFLIDEKDDDEEARPKTDESRPTTIDTAQFRIPKPSLAEWLQRRLIWLTLGGFALTGIAVAAALPRASLAAPPPAIVITVPPPVQIAPPPLPPTPAPPPAQVAPPAPRLALAASAPAARKKPFKKLPRARKRRR